MAESRESVSLASLPAEEVTQIERGNRELEESVQEEFQRLIALGTACRRRMEIWREDGGKEGEKVFVPRGEWSDWVCGKDVIGETLGLLGEKSVHERDEGDAHERVVKEGLMDLSSKESSKEMSKEISSKESSKESPKEISSKESSKEISPKEMSKEISSKESSKEISSKEMSKESSKESSKEISSKESSKESPKEISSKESSKEISPKEMSKEISSKESSKEISSKEMSKESSKESSKEISSKEFLKDLPSKESPKEISSKDLSSIDVSLKDVSPKDIPLKEESTEMSRKDPLKEESCQDVSSIDQSYYLSIDQSNHSPLSLPANSPTNNPDSYETPDHDPTQNPSRFLLRSALQLMHSCLEIDPFSDKTQKDPFDANCCSHGRIDPICGFGGKKSPIDCRTHFKTISEPFLDAIQATTNRPFHAIPITEAICDECEKAYISFLQMIGETQTPLNDLYSAIHDCKEKPPFLDNSTVMISSHFLNSLKLTLRARKRILTHPDHCTPSLLHVAQTILNPTEFILCVVFPVFLNRRNIIFENRIFVEQTSFGSLRTYGPEFTPISPLPLKSIGFHFSLLLV